LDDYIKREDAVNILMEYERKSVELYGKPIRGCASMMVDIVDIEPSDVRPVVRGRWIPTRKYDYCYKCSVCNETGPLEPDGESAFKCNFCPSCGADMREVRPDG
jgi:hypothetical protein